MSKIRVFAAYDNAVRAYLAPFHARSDSEALRIFADAVRAGSNNLSEHPEDFSLFYLGEFDQETGQYASVTPIMLATAMKFVRSRVEPEAFDAGDEELEGN